MLKENSKVVECFNKFKQGNLLQGEGSASIKKLEKKIEHNKNLVGYTALKYKLNFKVKGGWNKCGYMYCITKGSSTNYVTPFWGILEPLPPSVTPLWANDLGLIP